MGSIFIKKIDQNIFKHWTYDMSYLLGYIVADGCLVVDKKRTKHPLTLNITSIDKKHLYKLRKILNSEHKIGKKNNSSNNIAFQLAIRNPIITHDLINLGILPRKTYNLNPIKVPDKYLADFVRGFFDGDGTVYIYKVNNVSQIKAKLLSTSLSFITDLNRKICDYLNIPLKTINKKTKNQKKYMPQYEIHFYIDDCKKLFQFMYKNNKASVYLTRKYNIFKKWQFIKRRHYIKQKYPSKIGWGFSYEDYDVQPYNLIIPHS